MKTATRFCPINPMSEPIRLPLILTVTGPSCAQSSTPSLRLKTRVARGGRGWAVSAQALSGGERERGFLHPSSTTVTGTEHGLCSLFPVRRQEAYWAFEQQTTIPCIDPRVVSEPHCGQIGNKPNPMVCAKQITTTPIESSGLIARSWSQFGLLARQTATNTTRNTSNESRSFSSLLKTTVDMLSGKARLQLTSIVHRS